MTGSKDPSLHAHNFNNTSFPSIQDLDDSHEFEHRDTVAFLNSQVMANQKGVNKSE
jgi:hypothetical protein